MLPGRRRTLMVYALCVVLVSPVVKLYKELVDWRERMRVRAGGSPQVCMLRQVVKDELGIDVLIEEGGGRPTDFIVKTSFVNIDVERRLFALLDMYKLAGKSYGYENAEIEMGCVWSGYLCEKLRDNAIAITLHWLRSSDSGRTRLEKAVFRLDFPAKSSLAVRVTFTAYRYGHLEPRIMIFTIVPGEDYVEWAARGPDIVEYLESAVYPDRDGVYNYSLKVFNEYG